MVWVALIEAAVLSHSEADDTPLNSGPPKFTESEQCNIITVTYQIKFKHIYMMGFVLSYARCASRTKNSCLYYVHHLKNIHIYNNTILCSSHRWTFG